jgi:hypothetical protein
LLLLQLIPHHNSLCISSGGLLWPLRGARSPGGCEGKSMRIPMLGVCGAPCWLCLCCICL